MKFIDEIPIQVRSGNGGPGCVSFYRAAFVPRGGPDGGDGGKGGSVIFRVDSQVSSLHGFRPFKLYAAGNGQPGGGDRRSGKSGEDLILSVPVGTLVRDRSSKETFKDLGSAGEIFTFLEGGRGGLGNWHFRSSREQAPRHAQPGESGILKNISLELQVVADVALLGLPNAGKSTLLSRVSRATPKIADYPFTTVRPELGVVLWHRASCVMADLPGLIEQASQGHGLGTQNLKHLQRASVLVHVVDAAAESPVQAYHLIRKELELYDIDLLKKTEIIVLNKMDMIPLLDQSRLLAQFHSLGEGIVGVSGLTGVGMDAFLSKLFDKLHTE